MPSMLSIFPRGIENGIEYRYFSRYRIEVRNSSIVTTLPQTRFVWIQRPNSRLKAAGVGMPNPLHQSEKKHLVLQTNRHCSGIQNSPSSMQSLSRGCGPPAAKPTAEGSRGCNAKSDPPAEARGASCRGGTRASGSGVCAAARTKSRLARKRPPEEACALVETLRSVGRIRGRVERPSRAGCPLGRVISESSQRQRDPTLPCQRDTRCCAPPSG